MPGGGADAARRGRTHRVVVWARRSSRSASTSRRGAGRPAGPAAAHPVAGAGDRGRLVTGHAAGLPARLCLYWSDGYDWRAAEARMNALPQFRTTIDGLDSTSCTSGRQTGRAAADPHARVARLGHRVPRGHRAAHRPGRVRRRPADAFHVVCPSLPGYGFSGKPADRLGRPADRGAWATLMARLGYERYGAQGGDWGTASPRSASRTPRAWPAST